MHGAALAEEAAAKRIHHAIGLHQLAPEPLRGVAVIGGVFAIALEREAPSISDGMVQMWISTPSARRRS
jgi:hypothetical protein